MIIRSQDKKHITTDMNLEIVTVKLVSWKDIPFVEEVKEDEEVKWESKIYNSAGLLLGTYSTEAKAINVLNMIEACYVDCNCQYVRNKVFQMPADEDSEV